MTTTQPWHRQHGETEPAYQAFEIYRDLGKQRSLVRVAGESGKHVSLMERWSKRWAWPDRARAFDNELQRQADAEFFSEARKTERSKRHAEIAQLQSEALALPARELLRRLQETPELLHGLTVPQLVVATGVAARALNRTVVTERLALGLSTDNLGGHDGGPLAEAQRRVEQMTDEEIDHLIAGGDVASLDAARATRLAQTGDAAGASG